VDRRRAALVLLMAFILCIGGAVVVSGTRPGLQQGIAPTVVAFVGYLLAAVAAVLLIAQPADDTARKLGAWVLGAVVVLVLLDLVAADGPNIGAGLVQLVGELVILVATVRLALGVARAGRAR
jgi:hypothetical protein